VKHLRFVNTLLLVAIILVNGYILLIPLFPALTYWWDSRNNAVAVLEQKIVKPTTTKTVNNQPDGLVIPSMLLDEPIYTGSSAKTLRKGLWVRPTGSTPDQGGNTVIAGHRFTYADPRGSLYHLDKVRVGDPIGLYWQGKKYAYTVREVKVVKATDISIEAPTKDNRLTIYTCTPLWLPKDRLAIIAEEAS